MAFQYSIDLEVALSSDRLTSYRPHGGDDLDMITTYFWNVALCQALYPSLGALEVAMRNGIHRTLSIHFSQDTWYDRHGVLQKREQASVEAAKKTLRDAKKPITPGRIIAALHFGFWTSLLSSLYGNSPKGPQLWISPNSPLLAAAFPHAPAPYHAVRGRIHTRFDELRHLRNRVPHYEPVWNGVLLPTGRPGKPGRLVPLTELHANVIETIGWVSPSLQAAVKDLDSFTNVYSNGFADTQTKIEFRMNNSLIIKAGTQEGA